MESLQEITDFHIEHLESIKNFYPVVCIYYNKFCSELRTNAPPKIPYGQDPEVAREFLPIQMVPT